MSKNIEIHIDRIVLEGPGPLNKEDLHIAIQEHLSSLIAEQGLSNSLLDRGYHRKLNGGEMNWSPQPKPISLGNAIANGIFNGIQSTE